MATRAHLEANKRYIKSQEEIKLRAKAGTKARYKEAAAINGQSMNAYMLGLVEADIERNPQTAHLAKETSSETSTNT